MDGNNRKDKFNWDKEEDVEIIYPGDPNYEKELHTDIDEDEKNSKDK